MQHYKPHIKIEQWLNTFILSKENQKLASIECLGKIGRMIVEEEQGGKERAEYGKYLLKGLSEALTKEFGKGFSVRNTENMRQFYLVYSK